MRIEDFPRPQQDNRRGVYWSALARHPSGTALDFWLAELQAMQIKWVKLLDDGQGSSLELCRRLLAAGMLPIVRIDRGPQPNPGHLGDREAATISGLVAAGVRYFETNHEPDLTVNWHSRRPADWAAVVAENFVIDAQMILGIGGLPALPALSAGGAEAIVDAVIAQGWAGLLEAGVWVAVHSYTLNRPLDYPFDPVSQAAQPLSQEDYVRLGPWAWEGRPLEVINAWRTSDARSGATLADAGRCFLAWRLLDEHIAAALGHSLPIIATEGGPVVGWQDDRRYPRLDAAAHADLVVHSDSFLAGRDELAGATRPPHFFALCYSVLANSRLGAAVPGVENSAWYTDRWDAELGLHGVLPAVAALKAPIGGGAYARPAPPAAAGAPAGGGSAALGAREAAAATRLAAPALGVAGMGPAPAAGARVAKTTRCVQWQPLPPPYRPPAGPQQSALGCKIMDLSGAAASGAHVTLWREDVALQELDAGADGVCRFYNLPAGVYQVAVDDITVAGLALDGTTRRGVKLTLGTPGVTTGQVDGVVRGGQAGAALTLTAQGETLARHETLPGTEGAFVFANLAPGCYTLALEHIGVIARDINLAPGGLFKIVFALHSTLAGRIEDALPGTRAVLHAPPAWGWTRQCLLAGDGSFAFAGLPSGHYVVHVAGRTFVDLDLTGENSLELPPTRRWDGQAALTGKLLSPGGRPQAGVPLILRREGLFVGRTRSAADGGYRFVTLEPGIYSLQAGDTPAGEVSLAADETAAHDITLDIAEPEAPAQPAAGVPATSVEPGPAGSNQPSTTGEAPDAAGPAANAPAAGAGPDRPDGESPPADGPAAADDAGAHLDAHPFEDGQAAAADSTSPGSAVAMDELVALSLAPSAETASLADSEGSAPAPATPAGSDAAASLTSPIDLAAAALVMDLAPGLNAPAEPLAVEDSPRAPGEPAAGQPIDEQATAAEAAALAPEVLVPNAPAEPLALDNSSLAPDEPAAGQPIDEQATAMEAAALAPAVLVANEPAEPLALDNSSLAPDEPAPGQPIDEQATAMEAAALAPAVLVPGLVAGEQPAAASVRPIFAHYLLFGSAAPPQPGQAASGSAAGLRLNVSMALEYLRRTGASGGFSLAEACQAARVTIVGDQVPLAAEQLLRAAGCQVTRLAGDGFALAGEFVRLLAAVGEG